MSNSGTLFVAADQGLGDSVSFARFVVPASKRVRRVVFQVQPELLRLLTGAFAPYPNVEVVPLEMVLPAADAWCPVMSLPVALGMTNEEIVSAPQGWRVPETQQSVTEWRDPTAKLHVGICWAGSPANEMERWRGIPVEHFAELARVPGVALYSLQVGEAAQALHTAGMAGLVRDLAPWIRDAQDTAELIRGLDVVVACESFVAHLAGSLNKRTWVLVARNAGDWRLGRTDDRPPVWYRKHRVFRQGDDAAWGPVFARVVEALEGWWDR